MHKREPISQKTLHYNVLQPQFGFYRLFLKVRSPGSWCGGQKYFFLQIALGSVSNMEIVFILLYLQQQITRANRARWRQVKIRALLGRFLKMLWRHIKFKSLISYFWLHNNAPNSTPWASICSAKTPCRRNPYGFFWEIVLFFSRKSTLEAYEAKTKPILIKSKLFHINSILFWLF